MHFLPEARCNMIRGINNDVSSHMTTNAEGRERAECTLSSEGSSPISGCVSFQRTYLDLIFLQARRTNRNLLLTHQKSGSFILKMQHSASVSHRSYSPKPLLTLPCLW